MSRPKEPHLIARRLGHAPWAVYGSPRYLALHGKPSLRGRLRGHLVVAGDAELSRTVGARWLAKHGNSGKVVLRCNTLISPSRGRARGDWFVSAAVPVRRSRAGPGAGSAKRHRRP